MAHIYEKVVALISKEPAKRDDRDVDLLIPWFQNMSGLFKSQKTDVVKDIVRNCDFLSVPADTVIIKQGDKGDCFYINLAGSVSVYINQALEEQGNITQPSSARDKRTKSRWSDARINGLTPFPPGSKPGTRPRSPSGRRLNTTATRTSGEVISASDVTYPSQELTETHEKQNGSPNYDKASSSLDNNNILKDDESSTASRIDISIEDFSSSQGDSGRSSHAVILDDNKNNIFDDDNDDDDDVDSEFDYSSDEEDIIPQSASTTKLDRGSFGVHIRELGAGKSFGELALVQTNLIRTSSIITEQQTDLIVINRELYNRSLKAAQQHEFNLKKNFVNKSPLFRNWNPRQRSVMSMSLTRYQYQYGNTVIRQGAPVRGLHFITQGSAKVTTDTVQHITQYPTFCSEQDVQFAKDVKTGRGSRVSHPGSKSWESASYRRGSQHCFRRRETYAEAEKHNNYKSTDICVIGAGDYIGDFEVLLRLPTYSQSVICDTFVDTFELDLNNFERQVAKRSPTTYASLRETAETKLRARVKRLNRDEQIYMPVLEAMLSRLQELNTPAGWRIQNRTKVGSEDVIVSTAPWHNYREKQRQFLRHRQREKRLQEMRNIQMAHATSLGVQLEIQNMSLDDRIRHFDATIERSAAEIFPDVPSNVKLRIDPVSGLIKATEIRIPRNHNPNNPLFASRLPASNGPVGSPRSRRALSSPIPDGNKSEGNNIQENGTPQVSKLMISRLKNMALSPRYHQSAHWTTPAAVTRSKTFPSARPASSTSPRTRQRSTQRPASRSAGPHRYSMSF